MDPTLENALVGEPVTVTLAGKQYELAYPLQGVMLYKTETARVDRARAHGRPKLTHDEKRDLRGRRTAVLKTWPLKPLDEWTSEDVSESEELLGEATSITCTLDEDAGTGDSLYLVRNWRKIGTDDFERLLLALWVGLHKATIAPGVSPHVPEYRPQVSMSELAALRITDTELEKLINAINRALSRSLIATRAKPEAASPNVPAPETPAETEAVVITKDEIVQTIEEEEAKRERPTNRTKTP